MCGLYLEEEMWFKLKLRGVNIFNWVLTTSLPTRFFRESSVNWDVLKCISQSQCKGMIIFIFQEVLEFVLILLWQNLKCSKRVYHAYFYTVESLPTRQAMCCSRIIMGKESHSLMGLRQNLLQCHSHLTVGFLTALVFIITCRDKISLLDIRGWVWYLKNEVPRETWRMIFEIFHTNNRSDLHGEGNWNQAADWPYCFWKMSIWTISDSVSHL